MVEMDRWKADVDVKDTLFGFSRSPLNVGDRNTCSEVNSSFPLYGYQMKVFG